MSELYNKVYNLFNQWLSTEEEDEEEFKEWLNSKFIFENGKVIVDRTTLHQSIGETITIEPLCTHNESSGQWRRELRVSKTDLLPSNYNSNQQIQVTKDNTVINPNSSSIYLLATRIDYSGCPSNSQFTVTVTISQYINDDVVYEGLEYIITVPQSTGTEPITCNVEVVS